MVRYLLDTDIFIHVRRGGTSSAAEKFRNLKAGEAAVSVISYGELMYGVEKSASRQQAANVLEGLIQLIPVLPLPAHAAEMYGRLRAGLEKSGQMIGSNDLWIAAHARAADLVLVTNNEREFRRIPELQIENWAR